MFLGNLMQMGHERGTLELAWNKGIRFWVVESASVAVISGINSQKDWHLVFTHTLREGNRCID